MRERTIWRETLGLLVFRVGWLSREGFYKTLSNLGVLPGLEISLQSSVKVPASIKYCVFICVVWIRITLIRFRILLFTWCRFGFGFYLSLWCGSRSDHFFGTSSAPKWPSKASTFSLWFRNRILLFTLMRIRIQLPKMMRICNTAQCSSSRVVDPHSFYNTYKGSMFFVKIRAEY